MNDERDVGAPWRGLRTTLALVVVALVASFLGAGLYWSWWRFADQDVLLAYQGLLRAGGLPQEYLDHTGYLSYLLLGAWYRLLHGLGLLSSYSLVTLPPPADSAPAWQALVRAGRVLSLAISIAVTILFAGAVRRITRDWRATALATVALAFGGGMVLQARIIRTELIAASLFLGCLLLLLLAAHDARSRARPFLVGLATLCAVLALEQKVQVLLPLLTLPLLVPALAIVREPGTAWLGWRLAWPAALVASGAALAVGLPAVQVLADGFARAGESMFAYPDAGPLAGWYPLVLLAWFLGALCAFAAWRRLCAAETVAVLACAVAGAAMAVLALLIAPHLQNVIALTHPVEHMAAFANVAGGATASTVPGAIAHGLGDAVRMHVLAGLHVHQRQMVLVELLLLAVVVVAWRRGDRRPALQAALLMATVLALESAFSLRGLKAEYLVFTEPLVALAAGIALSRVPEAWERPAWRRALGGGLVAFLLWAGIAPTRVMLDRSPPSPSTLDTRDTCAWAPYYLTRIERLPFCPQERCSHAGAVPTCWTGESWRLSGNNAR